MVRWYRIYAYFTISNTSFLVSNCFHQKRDVFVCLFFFMDKDLVGLNEPIWYLTNIHIWEQKTTNEQHTKCGHPPVWYGPFWVHSIVYNKSQELRRFRTVDTSWHYCKMHSKTMLTCTEPFFLVTSTVHIQYRRKMDTVRCLLSYYAKSAPQLSLGIRKKKEEKKMFTQSRLVKLLELKMEGLFFHPHTICLTIIFACCLEWKHLSK